MSNIIIEDAGWAAIMADPQLQRARSKLSFHEIRLIVNHARTFRKHSFWGAGEPDCPREIKAGNGELWKLRCKVCGEDNPRDERCFAVPAKAKVKP
jgi:hypothetical protein